MNIDTAGEHLIAQFEGFRPDWYPDSGGVQTIGYGHTGALPAGFVAPLTVDAGLALLKHDCQTAVTAVNAAVKVRLGILPGRAQNRYNALYSLCFNIGGGAFSGSSLVRAINAKGAPRDWAQVGPYWLEWDHVGSAIVPGLLTRRRAELALFIPGK